MNALKRSGATFGFALLLFSPGLAAAQQMGPPPEGPPGGAAPAVERAPDPARTAAMREARVASERIREQARVQMLGALTPQHRTEFATIVGAFAIAATRDAAVTAKQIDALLSVREARAVVAADEAARTNERSLHEAERARFEATLTPQERAAMATRMQGMKDARATGNTHEPSTDPGMMLLHTALGRGGSHDGPPGGPHDGPPGGPHDGHEAPPAMR